MFTTREFEPGMRVEVRPDSSCWQRGLRRGRVVKVGNRFVYVWFDENPDNVYRIAPHVLRPLLGLERWVRVIPETRGRR